MTPWQVRRSASLVYHTLAYKDTLSEYVYFFSRLVSTAWGLNKCFDVLVRSEDLPDLTRTQIWLNDSNRKMWNIARVPRTNCDIFATRPQPSSPDARSVVVLIHDFLYTVEVYDESGKPHVPAIIEQRLWSCIRDVENRLASGEQAKPVGILTTDDRDRWAEVRVLFGERKVPSWL